MKALILAGGSGTRLFPLSRKNFPKQFLKINGDKSLFQNTIERCLAVFEPKDIIISTSKEHKFLVEDELKSLLGNEHKNISTILEPVGRNTASAIALGIKFILDKIDGDENETLFVFPSDHLIQPKEKFAKCINMAKIAADNNYLVTFGIKPTKPETGYGYIESKEEIETDNNVEIYKVKKFHEKPNPETAEDYLKKGNFYWNSGMFAFNIKTMLNEFKNYASDIYKNIDGKTFDDVVAIFHKMPNISIDYAIMEKTEKAVVVPVDFKWSDVGSWDAVYEIMDKDNNNNAKKGSVVDMETQDSLIISSKRTIAAIGVKDLIVVETDDLILISNKGKTQSVKEVVEKLKNNKELKPITEFHTTVHRPWGSYTNLEQNQRYKIKKITVSPNEALSLQLHYHRSEHWIVVKGTAKVVLEDRNGGLQEYYVHENESIYVPKTRRHRIINPGRIPLEIIEVQVGEYVEEDDIVRFEDKYERE